MTIQELKGRAYDLIRLIEQAQGELRQVNQEIIEIEKKTKEDNLNK